jgi:tetratricopeptide (TPR) repeat protein
VRTLNNLGEAYLKMEDYEKATDYINQAYEMDSALNDEKLRMTIMTNRAKAYFYTKKIDHAKMSLAKAEKMAENSNSFIILKDVFTLNSIIAEQEGNPEKAIS